MPGLELLIPFLLATAVFAYMPGPALLYTAAQTMAGGRRAGLMAALGLHLGGYVHVLAAALGLSAILDYVPELYAALKLCGAAYLIWLGIAMLWQKPAPKMPFEQPQKTKRRALIDSFFVEMLNPKTALFFIAFLPQFADPSAGAPIGLQLLVLGIVVNLAFSSADVITVFLTSLIVHNVQRSNHGIRIIRKMGGVVLVGLGLRLAFARD